MSKRLDTNKALFFKQPKQAEELAERNALILQERLKELPKELASFKNNKVAAELLQCCEDLSTVFEALMECHHTENYLPLEKFPRVFAFSVDLNLDPRNKHENSLFLLDTCVSSLTKTLDRVLSEAIAAELQKNKPQDDLIKILESESAKNRESSIPSSLKLS